MSAGFQLRAPWYVRERENFDLRDPRALRPEIQMYDGTDFVSKLTANPADSLAFSLDDRWSYPVPVTPSPMAKGRDRFITSRLVHTELRKLYQPAHSRFYAVVVEVFCDSPGLPRAGSHQDIEVSFVMRRQQTSVAGDARSVRKLARRLMAELAKDQHQLKPVITSDLDIDQLWWAHEAERIRFEADHATLIDDVRAETEEQAWMVGPAGGQWRKVGTPPAPDRPAEWEERFPMWRIHPRADACEAAKTRSLWFGLVPTYSADHWTDEQGQLQPKLDDQAVYQVRCIVTKRPERGHENCPPKTDVSAPTRPFRLAAAFDPDGTKNRTISITAPDLRRLAARAGQKQGPGGVRISTPPQSRLSLPIDFKSIPGAKLGTPGGSSICTFPFELFFIVALFLFQLFLPIVVLAFQLWGMLALRFCIPRSVSFKLLADFFAAGGTLTELTVPGAFLAEKAALDEVIGVYDAVTELTRGDSDFAVAPDKIVDLVAAIDPSTVELTPITPVHLTTPPDPLCPDT